MAVHYTDIAKLPYLGNCGVIHRLVKSKISYPTSDEDVLPIPSSSPHWLNSANTKNWRIFHDLNSKVSRLVYMKSIFLGEDRG